VEQNTVCGDNENQDQKKAKQEKGVSFCLFIASEIGKLGYDIFHVMPGWLWY
jgi:hypothetical protein